MTTVYRSAQLLYIAVCKWGLIVGFTQCRFLSMRMVAYKIVSQAKWPIHLNRSIDIADIASKYRPSCDRQSSITVNFCLMRSVVT